MPDLTLKNYRPEQYGALLAHDLMDTSVRMDAGNGLNPDEKLRTIIIGIGGTGVRTIDQVKGAIQQRMKPNWNQYVSFLGIDASWTELQNAHYLDGATEGVCTTLSGVTNRMSNAATYPRAVRPFMIDNPITPGTAVPMGNLQTDGASRTRLIGKVKVHDQDPGNPGVDEIIVSKLQKKISEMAPLIGGAVGGIPAHYDIYVIGSGSGGTCSGTFMEMPSLIHMLNKPVMIHGILYLPDAIVGLDPVNANILKANGYATLKELNYYQGMQMRGGYDETWTYSDAGDPVHKLTSNDGFYSIPYLIGSPGTNAANASAVARETISEFLISMLVKATPIDGVTPFLSSAFICNATDSANAAMAKLVDASNPNEELFGTSHEFPKSFASIGFAEASAPQKVIRAYAVREVCQNAGLKPVSAETRANLAAAGTAETLLPFRGELDLMSASEGKVVIDQIMEPLNNLLSVVYNGSFNFINDLGQPADAVTWEAVKNNTYESMHIAASTTTVVNARTNAQSMAVLDNYIKDQYQAFRSNVQKFVEEEGPYAFVNLFEGKFLPSGGGACPGIYERLMNLSGGKQASGMPGRAIDVDARYNRRVEAKQSIDRTGAVKAVVTGVKGTQLNAWLDAFNAWAAERINKSRGEHVFGANGKFMELFVTPAVVLKDQIYVFGNLMTSLSDIYEHFGREMNSFEEFSHAVDGEAEVNIASINPISYTWLKDQADSNIAMVQARKFRQNLVAKFFADPTSWLEFPSYLVKTNPNGELALTNPDKPIPARQLFDNFVSNEIPMTVDVSILGLFEQLGKNGISYADTANQILGMLAAKSQVLFNGSVDQGFVQKYIKYPHSLITAGGEGPNIVEAITTAADVYGVPSTSIYPSDDTNSIVFYQQATAMEIYRIYDLENWERQYESQLENGSKGICMLHSKSPDVEMVRDSVGNVSYVEHQGWRDYPSIVQRDHPERPDPTTGIICHEGQCRLRLQKLIDTARELGVLYEEETAPGQHVVYRVNCDKTINWQFNVAMCMPDPNTGLLPQGKALAMAVANQNGKPFSSMIRPVMLNYAKLFSQPAATADYAWRYAARVLRAHQPMMIEVRQTCEKFTEWDALVKQFNTTILNSYRPGMMVYLLKGGVVSQTANGAWIWNQSNGNTAMLANYTSEMMTFLPAPERYDINNGLMGYHIYQKVNQMMPGELLNNEYRRAKEIYNNWVATSDMVPLNQCQTLVKMFEDEGAALLEKGAGNGNPPVSVRFRTAMEDFHKSQEDLLEIEKFYSGLSGWGSL